MFRPSEASIPSRTSPPIISLIVSTIGETEHFERMLDSLAAQRFKDFEVIVVDQSTDRRVRELLRGYESRLTIVYATSERGVSRGRNRGLELARGSIVAFPDDDCWYEADLLERIARQLHSEAVDGVFGRCLDAWGNSAAGRHARTAQIVDKHNVWSCGVSATIFFKKAVLDEIGDFDTSIGLGSGSPFQSGEETDLILRAIRERHVFRYDPSIVIFHDSVFKDTFFREVKRSWAYGLGMGLVLRRHGYGLVFVLYSVARPMGGSLLSLGTGQFRLTCVRIVRAAARLEGWRRGR
jgi:glycosyltransferase involved in cell wall biosynthesis